MNKKHNTVNTLPISIPNKGFSNFTFNLQNKLMLHNYTIIWIYSEIDERNCEEIVSNNGKPYLSPNNYIYENICK